jgi:hypothetical protein
MHGRCDCDNEPEWGCHYETYTHGGHDGPSVSAMPSAPAPEPLKALPKEVMPKE